MKSALIILNLLAAVVLVLLGQLAVAAHRAHAFSVYEELRSQHVLLERPDYDVEHRLSTSPEEGPTLLS